MTPPGAELTTSEIGQQPGVWREVAATVGDDAVLPAFLGPLLADPTLRIVLTGAGTSAYAGELVAAHLTRTLRRRVEAVATTDLVAAPHSALAEDVTTLLVSFARSGDSPESVATTELADALLSRCHHLVLTCNADGRLARAHRDRPRSHVVLLPARANDGGFAMTSSFTGMVLAALLALDPPPDPTGLVDRLATAASSVLDGGRDEVRSRVPGHSRVVYVGSGPLHPLAREAALKLLELTAGGLVALGESTLGFRHGPKAVLTPDTLVVGLVANDPLSAAYDLDLLRELSVGGVPTVAVTTRPADLPPGVAAWPLPTLADVPDAYLALAAVVYPQLVGLESSLALGLTPDNPFPGGEVNRVVRGVTVHPLDAVRVP